MEAIETIMNSRSFFFLVIGAIAIVAILGGILESILRTRAQERSRREIAAYIAEGSITPEQGERLMKSTPKKSC
ncbi:MAG: hypothetical protein EA376_07865 [Phycisphaeraceae bacterium]|nr:MAG: hypothetical protein EA376_07865 [Phycisphaeraceae bacterium]